MIKKILNKVKKNSFLRKSIALLAALRYSFPSRRLDFIGVTGTTGKTTTTFMIKSILEEAGIKTGLIGTAGYYLGEEVIYYQGKGPGTTPDPFYLHKLLKKMVEKDIKTVIMEVSSYGLMYWRTYGVNFKTAVLTNISYNHHIAVHGSMENYVAEKLKLFLYLSPKATAVLPKESDYFNLFEKNTKAKIVSYGLPSLNDISAEIKESNQNGIKAEICFDNRKIDLNLKLPGTFNLYNALAAIGAARSFSVSDSTIKNGLEKIVHIPGRGELIESKAPFNIMVDKANTPVAFEGVTELIKSFNPSRKIVVYGYFEEIPKEGREELARIATDFFDLVIITEDDPMGQSPEKGAEDFLAFAKKNNILPEKYLTIINRKEAIREAIRRAGKNDFIAILGRGDEKMMVYKEKLVPFDDREKTREVLKEEKYL